MLTHRLIRSNKLLYISVLAYEVLFKINSIMADPLRKIARENFRAGGYLSSTKREQPNRWSYGGLPRSVSAGHNIVDSIMKRRDAARIEHSASTSMYRSLFAKLIGR